MADLTAITGQKPVITKSRKSIATFKLREGMAIGAKVTLRRDRMYEFLDRLITIALPRVRDFRGLNGKAFDGRGNFAMGLKEQIVFPEIDYDKVDKVRGMDIIICTTAKTDAEAKALLQCFRLPVRELRPERQRMAKTSSVEKNNRREQDGEAVRRQARQAEGDGGRRQAARRRSASPRGSSLPSCRATRRRRAFAIAAS